MKWIIMILFVLTGFSHIEAQKYDLIGGLRFGKGIGLTGVYRFSNRMTAEGIAFTNFGNHKDLTVLASYHGKIVFQKRLNYYVGAGAHMGSRPNIPTVGGAAFVLGLEFTISKYNISFDYLIHNNVQEAADTFERFTGISLRYVFLRRKGKRYLPKWNIKI